MIWSFLQLSMLLSIMVIIPMIKPIWRLMDRFAVYRPALVKEIFIFTAFIATWRFAWYMITTLIGYPDPTAPFVLHLGFLPDSMREFPFPFMLLAAPMPFLFWFLAAFTGVTLMIVGWKGLPEEGINQAVNIPNKTSLSLFFGGYILLSGILTYVVF